VDTQLEGGVFYDPKFFAYGEDMDLWFRMQLRGWTCVYVPAAVAWHAVSAASANAERIYEKPFQVASDAMRNRLWVIVANYPTRLLLREVGFLVAFEVAVFLFFLLRHPKMSVALLRAWYLVATSLRSLLRKRRRIMSSRRIGDRELLCRMRGKGSA
jgi:GT2 family glycosyltransferase